MLALVAATAIGSTAGIETDAAAQQYIMAPAPPPRVRREPMPARPSGGAVWTDGYWDYAPGTGYTWTAGRWVPARPGYTYVQPRWERRRGGAWGLVRGFWRR
jgi:hypothetical protein